MYFSQMCAFLSVCVSHLCAGAFLVTFKQKARNCHNVKHTQLAQSVLTRTHYTYSTDTSILHWTVSSGQ